MAFCTNCGNQMSDNAPFCTNCGNAMNVAPQPVQQPAPQPAPQQYVAPQPVQQPVQQPAPQQYAPQPAPQQYAVPQQYMAQPNGQVMTAKKSRKKLIIIIAVAVVLVAAIAVLVPVLIGGIGGGSYVGIWYNVNNSSDDYSYYYSTGTYNPKYDADIIISSNGKCIVDGDLYYYKNVGNNVLVLYSDETMLYSSRALQYTELNGNLVFNLGSYSDATKTFTPSSSSTICAKSELEKTDALGGVWYNVYYGYTAIFSGGYMYYYGYGNAYALSSGMIISDGEQVYYTMNGDMLTLYDTSSTSNNTMTFVKIM